MNQDEKCIFDHLIHNGYIHPIFEPDGNVPPDFLVDGKMAIEVRRLNQNENSTGKRRGIEETAIPLRNRFSRLLTSLGPPVDSQSWFISYHYYRPLPGWKTLEAGLRTALDTFENPSDGVTTISITPNFTVNIARASVIFPSRFLLAGFSDPDAGGFVVSEMLQNLRLCIEEKEKKIESVRNKYPIWWLALVDRTGLGADKSDYEEIKPYLDKNHHWDRIFVVVPSKYEKSIDLLAFSPDALQQ
jgi:hypothetical protein